MREYKTIKTTPEVWAVIHASHRKDLTVFGSFSDPNGTFNGGGGTHGKMFTSYGIKGASFPLLEAETTWEINQDKPYERIDEEHRYWLCLPLRVEE